MNLERESLVDFIWLRMEAAVRATSSSVFGKVNAEHLVPESCQRNGLRALSTSRIEYPERPIERGQVGRRVDG